MYNDNDMLICSNNGNRNDCAYPIFKWVLSHHYLEFFHDLWTYRESLDKRPIDEADIEILMTLILKNNEADPTQVTEIRTKLSETYEGFKIGRGPKAGDLLTIGRWLNIPVYSNGELLTPSN